MLQMQYFKQVVAYEKPNETFRGLCAQRHRWAVGYKSVMQMAKMPGGRALVIIHGFAYHGLWLVHLLVALGLWFSSPVLAGTYLLGTTLLCCTLDLKYFGDGLLYQFIFPIFHLVWWYALIVGQRALMQIASETLLKLQILTHGVAFTPAALTESIRVRAKGQNLVYNAPINFLTDRPQELFLTGPDGYCTVVSCVAPTSEHTVQIDIDKDRTLHAVQDGIRFVDVMLTFVQEPAYYMRTISNGDQVKQYVTACGYDELNIIPWKGCCIGRICKFCGSNITARYNRLDMTTAVGISHNLQAWYAQEAEYLAHLAESVSIAIQDPCYAEHAHIILISGNLSSPQLDEQASIYSRIAQTIRPLVAGKSPEGIVAVITPPHDLLRLSMLRDAGIDVVVFNLEVGTEPWFTKYCPGKSALGREFFLKRLYAAVNVFGRGMKWTPLSRQILAEFKVETPSTCPELRASK